MADDLKSMLMRVQQSRGRKSFTYAYATGKRNDGKGEGHLELVAGRKSFKKDDVADEVDKIGVFLQGRCWSASDGKSIFVQGKGLSHTVVVKMKLTAKTVTGRAFDLLLPDPDEERRAEGLEEEEESSDSESSESPQSSDGQSAKSSASSAKAGTFQAALAGAQGQLSQLQSTDPGAAAKVQKILTAAQGHADQSDFDKAISFVKEAGKLLAAAGLPKADGAAQGAGAAVAAAAKGAAGAAGPAAAQGAGAAVAAAAKTAGAAGAAGTPAAGNVKTIQTLLQKLGYDPGKIDGAIGPHSAAAIKKFQQANGLKPDGIAGPKTKAAMKQKLQAGAPAAGAKQDGQPPASAKQDGRPPAANDAPPQGNGAGLAAWQAARKEAVDDLTLLIKKVFATKHADAPAVIKEIHSIAKNLPEKPTESEIDKLEAYIRHEDLITATEEVPDHFHKLNIREPLLAALEGLKQGV